MTGFNTQLGDIVKSERSDIQHHGEEVVVPHWRERINHQHSVQLKPPSAPLLFLWKLSGSNLKALRFSSNLHWQFCAPMGEKKLLLTQTAQ